MDWRTTVLTLCLVLYADGFSKYGRTCKDIGCLNSEVCVLAEDPCHFGSTNCGTYPTCKKKSKVEGSHSEPAAPAPKPSAPRPAPGDDAPPSYPAPKPPSNNFGGNAYNPGSPYGGSNGGGSPYGGSSGGGSPYGGSTNGGGSPYGGNPYGGSSNGGGSPYGGSSNGGGSPYGGSSNGGGSPYGGNPYGSSSGGGSPYGGNPYGGSSNGGGSPYGGSPYGGSSNRGGSNPYGGNSPYGGSSSGGSSGNRGGSPLDSILNSITKYAAGGGGGAGGAGGSSGSGGSGLSSIFGNILGNLSKSGGINNLFNTRPIQENPNYSSYSSNSRSSNPQTYPSGYQQPNTQQTYQRNYGQRANSGTTTLKPVSYGWNVGATMVLTCLIHQYVQSMIRQ